MASKRDDKKNIQACNYKLTGDTSLYTGPPCLQPSGDRSAFDLEFINKYNTAYQQPQTQQSTRIERYKEFPASCTACNSCVDDPSDLYVQNNIPNHPMMRYMKK
jgi:hypothetical protein